MQKQAFSVKFNFSHNGTTVEDPENFADLEAFGNNNYSKELSDLGVLSTILLKIQKLMIRKLF
ncbi:hypothetical protein [Chryseobacterium indoltheticum]|uniref:hypothetical protein n=1 Tax=Chryseobacterium indoltheticum TaxID=254 RepID=UPI003F49229C